MCHEPSFPIIHSSLQTLRWSYSLSIGLCFVFASFVGSNALAQPLPLEPPLPAADDVAFPTAEQQSSDPAPESESTASTEARGIEFVLRSAAAEWPIVANDEPLKLTVQLRGLPSDLNARLTTQCRLIRISDQQVVMEHRQQVTRSVDGTTSPIDLTVTDLGQPGVYQWNVSLSQQEKAWSGLVRSEKTIARQQVPMAVYAPTKAGQSEQEQQPRISWRSTGYATTIDPWTRVTPDWIPDSATRLVPDITQVGEAIPIPTFGPAASKPTASNPSLGIYDATTPCLLTLPRYRAHQLTKFQLNVQSTNRTTDPIRLKLEYSASPNFQTITRSVPVVLWPELDLSAVPPLGTSALEVLHYPRQAQEYLRLTNLDSDNTVTLESVQVFTVNEQTEAANADRTEAFSARRPLTGSRSLQWHCRDQNWIRQLTPDLEPASEANDKQSGSDQTQQLYRAWIALQRLQSHAAWLGYQSVSVPNVTANSAEIQADSDESEQETTPNAETLTLNKQQDAGKETGRQDLAPNLADAIQRWAESLPIDVALRRDAAGDSDSTNAQQVESAPSHQPATAGQPAIAQQPAIDGALFAFDGNEDLTARDPMSASGNEPQPTMAHRLLTLLIQRNPHLTQIDAATLPMACQSAPREALHQFRLTPENSVVLPGAPTNPAQRETRHNVLLLASGQVAADFRLRNGINHLSLINRNPWATDITLQVQHDQSLAVNLVSLHPEIVAERVGAPADFRVRVPGHSIVNVKLDCPPGPAQISEWTQTVSDQPTAVNAINLYVRQVTNLLSSLQSPSGEIDITNGSFEQAGQAGMLGWLHSQVPSGAVQIDQQEAIEGQASLRMSNESQQAKSWLMSVPIKRPVGQRLAVSMAFRSALQGTPNSSNAVATAQQLRITLEGESDGQMISISNQIAVPQTGTWSRRQVVLQATEQQLANVQSVRLTIECLGKGVLWLDDIRMHNEFATNGEQAELKQLAFDALQGLAENDIEAAGPLFANRWAMQLLSDSLRAVPSMNSASNAKPKQATTNSLPISPLPIPSLRPRAEQSPWGNTRDIPNAQAADGAWLTNLPEVEGGGPNRILPFYPGISLPSNLPFSPNEAGDPEATTSPDGVTETSPKKVTQPGVADRIRDLVPKPFRY